jgi:acyl-CoA dehydrogenase
MTVAFPRSWMDEDLSLYEDTVVRFIESEILPHDEEWRKRGHVGREIWQKAGEAGLLCTDVPEEYGGGGADFRYEALFQEEAAKRALTGLNNSVHSIVAHYFLNHGTEEQKRRYLPRMASGELIGAIAMTEPDAGSDLKSIRTRAVRAGDEYVISGSKTFISNGYLGNLVLVVARTGDDAGARGISILIVETETVSGYRFGRLLDKIGLKAQDTSELFFDEVRVPLSCLLGTQEGQGFYQLMGDLPYERTLIGVIAVATMEGALRDTIAYVRERRAFGQSIFEFQNTRFKLAELAALVKVARTFIDRCIEDLVAGKLDTVTASMAKLWTTETQQRVVDECLQLFGGYGYMNEYRIARMFADSRVQSIYGGTNEIMKEVIARAL